MDPPHQKQRGPITQEELDRVTSRIRPFPLPADVTPVGTCDFTLIPPEVLLTTPPQLLTHLQRTAAQGGFQVVSPRQTPMSCLMSRISTPERHLGDHIVGSVADPDDVWPTIDGDSLTKWLPDEPLPPRDGSAVLRTRTKTKSLTSAAHMMTDPILACLVKGRAVIDVLNRPDVQGDGDAVAALLADAWGVAVADIMDLDSYSLGFEGDMLRHAIKVDDVYPTMYAPIHQRRSISVGCSEINRACLPADSAMDWRRMRVSCEAIFALTCSIEGIPLTRARAYPPPGDMSAAGNRANIMAFLPAPCTAWSYAAETFSLTPIVNERAQRFRVIPPEVLSALARYVAVARPVSHALNKGFRGSTRVTHLGPVVEVSGETLQSNFNLVTRRVGSHGARGRTAAATVRNYIFEAIDTLGSGEAMRLNRYVQVAKEEVKIHLSLSEMPDMIIDKLALKFLQVGETIRLKVIAECNLRGHTPTEWWKDITAQAAQRYKEMSEGTMGWAKVAMYLLFKQPTDKWRKLGSAINYTTVHDAAVRSVGGIALPPEKESVARVEAAARHVSKRVGMTYYGHYMGVADVGMAIADYLAEQGKCRSADNMRQAAYLWVLRARVFRAINITIVPPTVGKKNANHYIAHGTEFSINLAPAPYRHYTAYRVSALKSDILPKRYKNSLPEDIPGRVAKVFQDMKDPILHVARSMLTQYLIEPSMLGNDMERAWRMLVGDMDVVLATYGPQADTVAVAPQAAQIAASSSQGFSFPQRVVGEKRDYWDVIADCQGDEIDSLDDLLEEVGPAVAEMIMEGEYNNLGEVFKRVTDILKVQQAAHKTDKETVV